MKHKPDHEPGSRHPADWKRIKANCRAAFHLAELMQRLEDQTPKGASPRMLLGYAVHAWLAMSEDEKDLAIKGFYQWNGKGPIVPTSQSPQPAAGHDEDDEQDDWERDGEEWKSGGLMERDKSTLRLNPLAWISRLTITSDESRVLNVGKDRRVTASRDVTLEQLLVGIATARRIEVDAPSENLPNGEKVSDRDFTAAMWKALAPVGWKMPPVPDGVKLTLSHDDANPPMISDPVFDKDWRCYCQHCGKGYKDMSAMRRHVEKVHGGITGGAKEAA